MGVLVSGWHLVYLRMFYLEGVCPSNSVRRVHLRIEPINLLLGLGFYIGLEHLSFCPGLEVSEVP